MKFVKYLLCLIVVLIVLNIIFQMILIEWLLATFILFFTVVLVLLIKKTLRGDKKNKEIIIVIFLISFFSLFSYQFLLDEFGFKVEEVITKIKFDFNGSNKAANSVYVDLYDSKNNQLIISKVTYESHTIIPLTYTDSLNQEKPGEKGEFFPGIYRVKFLRHTKIILSAERLP